MFITLTSERSDEFIVNSDKITTIIPLLYDGGSRINFVDGTFVTCLESKEEVLERINKAELFGYDNIEELFKKYQRKKE